MQRLCKDGAKLVHNIMQSGAEWCKTGAKMVQSWCKDGANKLQRQDLGLKCSAWIVFGFE